MTRTTPVRPTPDRRVQMHPCRPHSSFFRRFRQECHSSPRPANNTGLPHSTERPPTAMAMVTRPWTRLSQVGIGDQARETATEIATAETNATATDGIGDDAAFRDASGDGPVADVALNQMAEGHLTRFAGMLGEWSYLWLRFRLLNQPAVSRATFTPSTCQPAKSLQRKQYMHRVVRGLRKAR